MAKEFICIILGVLTVSPMFIIIVAMINIHLQNMRVLKYQQERWKQLQNDTEQSLDNLSRK